LGVHERRQDLCRKISIAAGAKENCNCRKEVYRNHITRAATGVDTPLNYSKIYGRGNAKGAWEHTEDARHLYPNISGRYATRKTGNARSRAVGTIAKGTPRELFDFLDIYRTNKAQEKSPRQI